MILVPALLLAAQPALAAKRTTLASKTFPAAKVSRIQLYTEAGAVIVRAKPGAETKAEAFKPEDSKGHCDLKLSLEEGTLILEAKKPAGGTAVCDGGFEVVTPPGVELEVYTGSGDVSVTGAGRTLKVRTGSGDVTLKAVKGQAYALTGSGRIDAELPSAAFDARTGSGDVKVTLTQGSGLISARSGSGSLTVLVPKGAKAHVRATTASGKVTNEAGEDAKAPLVIEAFSGSGDVTIKTSK